MADTRYQPQTRTGAEVQIDQGLRSYMLKVYNYLHGGEQKIVSHSNWLNNYYQFDASRQGENFFYILHYFPGFDLRLLI